MSLTASNRVERDGVEVDIGDGFQMGMESQKNKANISANTRWSETSDRDLLQPDSSQSDSFILEPLDPPNWPNHFESLDPRYSQVETLVLRKCMVHSSQDPFASLARAMPNLRLLVMDQSRWIHHACENQEQGSKAIVLDKLERLEITRNTQIHVNSFDTIRAPSLRHLDLWEKNVPFPAFVRSSAWAAALPNLLSLDIGGSGGASALNLANIVELLKDMPNLLFLNVSFRDLDDDFLRALTVGVVDKPLVPNLVAISIAGLPITSIALRDFALSRVRSSPITTRPVASQPKRSLFGPSSTGTNMPASASGMSRPTPRALSVAQLRWLCLDANELLDAALPQYLAKKIPYVSWRLTRNPGSQDEEDRFRGRGRYAWDREFYDSCSEVEGQKCGMVLTPGKRNRGADLGKR